MLQGTNSKKVKSWRFANVPLTIGNSHTIPNSCWCNTQPLRILGRDGKRWEKQVGEPPTTSRHNLAPPHTAAF